MWVNQGYSSDTQENAARPEQAGGQLTSLINLPPIVATVGFEPTHPFEYRF